MTGLAFTHISYKFLFSLTDGHGVVGIGYEEEREPDGPRKLAVSRVDPVYYSGRQALAAGPL